LFAKSFGSFLIVSLATGVHPTAQRTRTSFRPQPTQQQREIEELFVSGYHYVGEWHTHPERQPTPSVADSRAMRNLFLNSEHQLVTMLLVIVGNERDKMQLYVGCADGVRLISAALKSPDLR